VCESVTSRGPDFLDVAAGLFCDMEEKELWPVCDANITTGCFDSVNLTMKGSIPGAVRARDSETEREIPSKEYETWEVWSQALVR
jgi:hypothetical protein